MSNNYDHNKRAKEIVEQYAEEGTMFFTDYAYDTAIIGVSNDSRIIYDYNKMVEYLLKYENFETIDEAEDWISYNTLGSLSSDLKYPIIMFKIYN